MTAVRTAFVRKMAGKILKESRIEAPPVDLVAILRKPRNRVRRGEGLPGYGRRFNHRGRRQGLCCCQFTAPSTPAPIFASAELGHYFLHKDGKFEEPITIDSPPSEDDEPGSKDPAEIEADLFAGELLVPLEILKLYVKKDIPELSKIFLVASKLSASPSASICARYSNRSTRPRRFSSSLSFDAHTAISRGTVDVF